MFTENLDFPCHLKSNGQAEVRQSWGHGLGWLGRCLRDKTESERERERERERESERPSLSLHENDSYSICWSVKMLNVGYQTEA
jgi:hypothetical protein